VEYLDTLLREQPDNAEALAERGRACGDLAKGGEALRCLRRAFVLQPRAYTIGSSLLAELRSQGKDSEADRVSRQVQALKEHEERIQELTAKVHKTPRNAPVRHELGVLYLKAGNEDTALSWLFGALQDDPDYRPTHKVLADYYQRKGDSERAAIHRQRAAGVGP
jgi:thioredoxin-like negative regulator of GroEL